MQHAIDFILSILVTLAQFVLWVVGIADAFLAGLMRSAGVPPNLQIVVLIIVAVMLIIFAIRVLGGVFGFLLVILLILLIAHQAFPGMQMPHSLLQWQSGSIHI